MISNSDIQILNKIKKAKKGTLFFIGEISRLAIQALKTIGKENVTEEEIRHIQTVLQNEKPSHLAYDSLFAPVWIQKIMKHN